MQDGRSWFYIGGIHKVNLVIYLICITWVILILISPAFEEANTIHFGNKGLVGFDEHYDSIENMENPFVRVVYHSGDRMCHMRESRSLIIGTNQMPYCARCFGIFFGMALGAAIATFVVIDLKWWMIVLGLVPIALDGGLQAITSYESNNVLRLFTGLLVGVITMLALGLVAIEMSESIKMWMMNNIWKRKTREQDAKYP